MSPPAQVSAFILGDPYLREVYASVFRTLAGLIPDVGGAVVEIGAGSALGRTWIPGLICTDIVPAGELDAVVDAQQLPFAPGSLRAIVVKDGLHHLPDVAAFLDEAVRCLTPGGAVLMCEPYWGPLARLVYTRLHPEPYDPARPEWHFTSGSAWDSNQALPWILLRRDRARLHARWPHLRVREIATAVGPSYLLSGGVFSRTPLSGRLLRIVHRWEQGRGRSLDRWRLSIIVSLERIR